MVPSNTRKMEWLILIGGALLAVLFLFRTTDTLNPLGWLEWRTAYRADMPTLVEQMRSLSKLETASFAGQKIVEVRRELGPLPGWLAGDRVLFVAHGIATAGVDLGQMTEKDAVADGDGVRVRLPRPALFSVRLDDRSFVYDHHPGVLTGVDPAIETDARSEAETEIRDAAISSGILDRAAASARATVERLFHAAGIHRVIFI